MVSSAGQVLRQDGNGRTDGLTDISNLTIGICGLLRDLKRQSPQEPLPTSTVKAEHLRVVTETYKKGIELHIDIDRTGGDVIKDKIMTSIRLHNIGTVGKDVGNVSVGRAGPGVGSTRRTSAIETTTRDTTDSHGAQSEQDQGEYRGQNVLGFKCKGAGKEKGKHHALDYNDTEGYNVSNDEDEEVLDMLCEKMPGHRGHCQTKAPMCSRPDLLEETRVPPVSNTILGDRQHGPTPTVVGSGAGETVAPSERFEKNSAHVSEDQLGELG